MELNKHSKRLTQDESQPASQAMLYAVGLSDEDMNKAQVGIASTGYDGNPCNMHLNNLAAEVKVESKIAGLVGLGFNTIGVSDGISMGTSGMNYSLASRDIIADSIETVMNAQSYDGLISVVGCDKNMPGAVIAMLRLNRPSIMMYGGTIASGNYKGKKLNIVSAFEALGQKVAGEIEEEEYREIIKKSHSRSWCVWRYVYCKYNGFCHRVYGGLHCLTTHQYLQKTQTNYQKQKEQHWPLRTYWYWI